MLKLLRRTVCASIVVLSSLMWGQYYSLADDLTDDTYSVKPIFNSDQNQEVSNYYSVEVDGELKNQYDVEITNNSDMPLSLTVESLNAYTGPYGLIQYGRGKDKQSEVLFVQEKNFTNYVDILDIITIEPNSVGTFTFDVDIPKLDGTILGALSFKTLTQGEQTGNKKVSIQINNEINNIIAFEADFGNHVLSSIEFGKSTIFHSESDTHVNLPIDIFSNYLIEGAELNYVVTDSQGKELFTSGDNPIIVHLVPTTEFELHIPWNYNRIDPEEVYSLTGSIVIPDEPSKTFEFYDTMKYQKVKGASKIVQMRGGVYMDESFKLFDSSWGIAGVVLILALIVVVLIKVISAKILIRSNRKYEEGKGTSTEPVEDIEEELSDTDVYLEGDDEVAVTDDGEVYEYQFVGKATQILDAHFNDITNMKNDIDLELLDEPENFLESTDFLEGMEYLDLSHNRFPMELDHARMTRHTLDLVDDMHRDVDRICVSAIYKLNEEKGHNIYELKYIIIP